MNSISILSPIVVPIAHTNVENTAATERHRLWMLLLLRCEHYHLHLLLL
jgi:hypothetical protein